MSGLRTPSSRLSFRTRLRLSMLLLVIGAIAVLLFYLHGVRHHPLPYQGLVYCIESGPETFNSQHASNNSTLDIASRHLYDRLLNIDSNGAVGPGLAESWQISDDGRAITLELKRGVAFHDTSDFQPTRLFNADDVIFSFNRILDDEHPFHWIGGDYPFFRSLNFRQRVSSLLRLDEHRVQFRLQRPDAAFLAILASDFAPVLSAEYAAQLRLGRHPEHLDQRPVGTGPFKLRRYRPGHAVILERHRAYWGQQPTLDRLVFDITANASIRLGKLITGECDAIAMPSTSEYSLIHRHPQLALELQSGFNTSFIAFNSRHAPFTDARVRRALALAIDRQRIVDAIFQGGGSSAHSLLPAASWGYLATPGDQAYAPPQASALLAAAGLPKGFDFTLWVPLQAQVYNPNPLKMAQMIQADLKLIGVRAEIASYDGQSAATAIDEQRYDAVLLGWSGDSADPDSLLTSQLSCPAIANGSNRALWCDPAFDALLAQARATADHQLRRTLYHQAQLYLHQQQPLLPLAHGLKSLARRQDIAGLRLHPYNALDLTGANRN